MDKSSNTSVRILHVVTYMGRGGLETMIMNYYRHIDRCKVQFDFLVHRDFRADYDDEIEALGGRIYRIQRLVPWSRNYKNELENFFRAHPEYKIVHVHQDCLSAVALCAAKKCGIPVRITHSHNSSQDKNLKYLIKIYYKRKISKFATDLFACGKEAGDWMFGGAAYRVLNNAIDAKSYAFDSEHRIKMRKELGITDDAFVVGHVGRFHPQKNHIFLLDVFAEIKKQQENAKLLLVGDGELRNEAEKKAELLGIKESVIFTGVRSDVSDLMQAMDVFAFPSVYEGLPVTLIEAQAAGLWCVVSDGVPKECDVTKLVKHISLKKEPNVWAQEILSKKDEQRPDMKEKIASMGYDIGSNADWLQNYYLAKWEKEKKWLS